MPQQPLGERAATMQWWHSPLALERFITDLIQSEARMLRPGGPWPPQVSPAQLASVSLGEDGLGFDSLERLGLAAALSETLHLHRGGLTDTLVTAPTLGGWVTAAAAALDRFAGAVTLRSSGTAGKRHSHTHPMARLEAEIAFWAGLLTGRRRVLAAVPAHHIYGMLFTLMLPARLGLPVVELIPLSPAAIAATWQAGDLVIGHPVFWELMPQGAGSGWPADIVGVTSGAPCPEAVARRAIEAGLSALLEIYGSSETAGIGWRLLERQGWSEATGEYRLLPAWRREPDGRIARDGEAPVQAPDLLCWTNPTLFRVGARRDGGVAVAGVTVDPAQVAAILRGHPGVADAAVRLMRPAEGLRLKAFVVPHAGASADLDALRASLARHVELRLTVPERPRAFRFGDTLPRTGAGKPADWPA